MASLNRIGGTISFQIDGTTYSGRGNFEVSPSLIKREGIVGQDGVQGYTEMPSLPSIKGDLTTSSNLSLTALSAIDNSTIQVALANGKTYVLTEAWVTAQFTINAAEGRVGIECQGMSIAEY